MTHADNLARIYPEESETVAKGIADKHPQHEEPVASSVSPTNPDIEQTVGSSSPPQEPQEKIGNTRDNRTQWVIKSRHFTPEFRERVRKAAKWSNMSQANYVYRTMSEAAEKVLKDRDSKANTDTLPIVLKEKTDMLEEALKTQSETIKFQTEQIERLSGQLKTFVEDDSKSQQMEELTRQVRALTEEKRKGFWSRIFS